MPLGPQRQQWSALGAKMRCRNLLPVIALALAIGSGGASSAQIRDKTFDGAPLSGLVDVQVNGVVLRLPAGYIWSSVRPGTVSVRPSLYFRFWMPDKRWPEIPPFSGQPVYRPPEPGRPPPGKDAYLVQVKSIRNVELSASGFQSPEVRFRNRTSSDPYSFELQPFGLVRFWRKSPPYDEKKAWLNYRHMDGSDPMVLVHCLPPDMDATVGPGNMFCDATVYLVGDRLDMQLSFPRDALPQWADIVCAARDLFLSWRVTPQVTPDPCRIEKPRSERRPLTTYGGYDHG